MYDEYIRSDIYVCCGSAPSDTFDLDLAQMRMDVLSACALACAPISPFKAGTCVARAVSRSSTVQLNLLGDLFNDNLKAQKPYERPLLPALVASSPMVYKLQEKLFSFSGEDFSVRNIAGDEVIKIEGANINIGGMVVDKLGFKDSAGVKFCSVERRIVAASTCYDIYSADGKELVAKVEREWLSVTPKYQ